jgi:putative tricarboxylic transport membrane protein
MELIDFTAVSEAFALLGSSWVPWAVIVPGILIGLIGGAMPGVSGTMTLAIVLPFTLYMDFFTAVMFLTSVFTGAGYGGAVPAILVNLPGTPASAATAFDGFPMARNGQHNEALGLGLAASVAGAFGSYLLLLLMINYAAAAVLKLGPFEMAMVAIWGLTLIASLHGGNMARGLLAGAFGLLIGTVGIGPTGMPRGTFGLPALYDGIPLVPAMIGLLATSELFNLAKSDFIVRRAEDRVLSFHRIMRGFWQTFRYWGTLLRGSITGFIIGAVPGVGASVANLISYAEARRTDPDPASFGKGNPKGVVASESADSSAEGGSMVTLFALGIPGGGGTAVLLAAFAMHNVTGGPRFIADNKEIVYAIIFGNLAQELLLAVVGLFFIRIAVIIVKVPIRVLVPSVLALATAGSFAMTGNIDGAITLAVFSVIGWVLARYDYATPAAVVGLLLGKLVEGEFVRSHQISGGDITFLLGRPIALGILVLILLSLLAPLVTARLRNRRELREEVGQA